MNIYHPLKINLVFVLLVLILAACGDNDSTTEPNDVQNGIEVYATDSFGGEKFDPDTKSYRPKYFDIDYDSVSYSGRVYMTNLGWMPIDEKYSTQTQFFVFAPDSIYSSTHIDYFKFFRLIVTEHSLNGFYMVGGPAIDARAFFFHAYRSTIEK